MLDLFRQGIEVKRSEGLNMAGEIRAEVRGIRLIVGAAVSIVFTYWFFTGRVLNPFAEAVVQSFTPETYGGPIGDLADILTAVFYVVGTATCLGAEFAWRIGTVGIRVISERLAGMRSIADLFRGAQWEELQGDPQEPASDQPADSVPADAPGTLLKTIATTVNKIAAAVNEHEEAIQNLSIRIDQGGEVKREN